VFGFRRPFAFAHSKNAIGLRLGHRTNLQTEPPAELRGLSERARAWMKGQAAQPLGLLLVRCATWAPF